MPSPPQSSTKFNIDDIMVKYQQLLDKQIDHLSAKLNLDPDHKDSLEALQLLDRMAGTIRLYHRSKARSQERRQTFAAGACLN